MRSLTVSVNSEYIDLQKGNQALDRRQKNPDDFNFVGQSAVIKACTRTVISELFSCYVLTPTFLWPVKGLMRASYCMRD